MEAQQPSLVLVKNKERSVECGQRLESKSVAAVLDKFLLY
jgi:hypothetical protein